MKNQISKALDLIYQDSIKFAFWKGLKRWVYIFDVISVIKLFTIDEKSEKTTREILIRLEASLDSYEKQMGKIMPLKALRIMINPLKRITKVL